ncbi:MAG: tetratricopeptide repeat protein [Acidobacteria bacterium]|jgi:tetratricopeptide (TPR) repeat protein|nr:tetratricopeptide repeat protein [Acidobacteriota bacterium]
MRAVAGLAALALGLALPPAALGQENPAAAPDAPPNLSRLQADAQARPNDAQAQAHYGLALARTGKLDEGLVILVRAAGMAPDDPTVLLLHAKGLMAAKRDAEAADVALRAARSPLASKKIAAEAYFTAGSIRWRQRSATEAEQYLREAVKLDPTNGGAQLNLGLFLYSGGNIAEGLLFMQQAADTSPQNAQVQMRLARVMEAMGKTDRAIDYWTRAMVLRPDDGDIRFILGNHLFAVGNYQEAAVQLARAIEIRESDANAHLAYGEALLRLKRFDEAQAQAEAAKRLGIAAPADSLMDRIRFERANQ